MHGHPFPGRAGIRGTSAGMEVRYGLWAYGGQIPMETFHPEKKKRKPVLLIIIMAAALIAVISVCVHMVSREPEFRLADEDAIEVEYGESYEINGAGLIDTSEYTEKQLEDLEENLVVGSDLENEEGKECPATGTYTIVLEYREETLTKDILVEDTTAPGLATEYSSIDIIQGTDLSSYDFQSLFSFSDLSPCTFQADYTEIDPDTPGSYTLVAIVSDDSGNTSELSLAVNITQQPGEGQEVVTETVTNEDGTKSIVNTIVDVETEEETDDADGADGSGSGSSTDSSTGSGSGSSSSSSGSSSGNGTAATVSDSFVADLSISSQCTQAVIVVGEGGGKATLTLHTKVNGVWVQQLSCSANVGRNGITSSKKEGDGKTPAGIYSFGQAFGTAGDPGSTRSWLQVNSNHYWVDDSTSQYYNQLVDASQTGIQWSSAEHLADSPTAYKYAIAINYNTACTPYAGSAIFLHCSIGSATSGCISIPESYMVKILQSLQDDTLIGIYSSSESLY